MKPSPIVEIIWNDAGSVDSWSGEVAICPKVHSVGLLVRKTKRVVVIALAKSDKASNGVHCCQLAIPRGAIRSMRVVAHSTSP